MNIKYLSFVIIVIIFVCPLSAKIIRSTLNISYFPGFPDGVEKPKILGINGQFPGPVLEAREGDTLEILVINNIQDEQNTSIHWHGIHQKANQFEDGVAQISQCPLPAGGRSQTFTFKVPVPGTYWYHSHHSSQYTEGLFGPLLVHAQNEAFVYDEEFTIILSDWYHQTAKENEEWYISNVSIGVPPYPDAGLMNGMGRYPCKFIENSKCDDEKQRRPVFNLALDKTYRIRLINAAAVASFNFSIDGHIVQTIEVDGIDVKDSPKVYADVVPIAAGQRYSFLFRCGENGAKNGSRYLIRANMRTESLILVGENINKHPEAVMGDVTGIIQCFDKNSLQQGDLVSSEKFTWKEIVPPQNKTKIPLVYLDEMDLAPLDNSQAPDSDDQEFTVNVHFEEDKENIRIASFNNSPFIIPHSKPLLMTVIEGESIPKSVIPLEINLGSVVQLIINNPFNGSHPFHLHGHHFWVVGLGKWHDGNYTDSDGTPVRNLTLNGVKRDTMLVQEKSWAVIRFVADNPGVWLFHCHIDWHNLSGMSLVFIEGNEIIREKVRISDEAKRVCGMHNNTNSSENLLFNEQKVNE